MNNKIIIEFGFRVTWRIMEVVEYVLPEKSICLDPETFSLSG